MGVRIICVIESLEFSLFDQLDKRWIQPRAGEPVTR
jgi:hypothetical protein